MATKCVNHSATWEGHGWSHIADVAIVPVAGSIASWLFLRWPDQYHLPMGIALGKTPAKSQNALIVNL